MAHLIRQIDTSKPLKIEVGSGGAPIPGYIHVDVDPSMPDLHAVCRMGKETLPFPDGCAEELVSIHSIEHVSWLDLPFLIKDWHRVLKPGGKLFLKTPDLEFVCKTYLETKTTKEHPVDEGNMVRIFGEYGPAHWANIKLFAGQNYPGNFHYFCFDFPMLHAFLERYGFESVRRLLNFHPVHSPGEIVCEALKKA